MKRIIALILASLMILSFTACSGDGNSDYEYIKNKGKMIVGITIYEPMNYYVNGVDGELTGFDTEFAQAVCKKLGVEAEFVIIDWDNKFPELKSKSIDCIWNGMTITDEVKANTNVSDPYVKNAQVVVMKSDLISKYGDFDSMKDLTFSAESGSAGAKLITEASYKIVEVADQAAALLEVQSGSADACVIDITMANAMTGEGTSYAELGVACELNTEEYGIGFRVGSDMTAKVNEIVDELIADGTLDKLAEKYSVTLIK